MRLVIDVAVLLGCILLCQAAGVLGVLVSDTGESEWYRALAKPSFNPPGWIFGVVWPVLYVMMGVSLYLLLRHWPASRWAIALFAVQLLLNASWTPVFFGLHQMAAALVILIALWATLVATLYASWQVSTPAALLLLPYFAWTSFAMILNATFWRLN